MQKKILVLAMVLLIALGIYNMNMNVAHGRTSPSGGDDTDKSMSGQTQTIDSASNKALAPSLTTDNLLSTNNNLEQNSKDIFQGNPQGTVFMQQELLDGDLLKISVMAQDMSTPTLGLAFHLNYEGDKIKFLKYEPGEFLERGGKPFYLVKNDDKKNEIIFGETLRRDNNFPVGNGHIADFYFQFIRRDTLNFYFKNAVVSTMDTVRQDIDKIIWENLSLDKNGAKVYEKISDQTAFANSKEILNDDNNAPINYTIVIVLIIVIIGLLVSIFLKQKKRG